MNQPPKRQMSKAPKKKVEQPRPTKKVKSSKPAKRQMSKAPKKKVKQAKPTKKVKISKKPLNEKQIDARLAKNLAADMKLIKRMIKSVSQTKGFDMKRSAKNTMHLKRLSLNVANYLTNARSIKSKYANRIYKMKNATLDQIGRIQRELTKKILTAKKFIKKSKHMRQLFDAKNREMAKA